MTYETNGQPKRYWKRKDRSDGSRPIVTVFYVKDIYKRSKRRA